MKQRVVVIAGPTASGKTALAVELALKMHGEVVSADSMQIYKRMNIGTAKPTKAEMCGVPHHMIDIAEPFENYSVSDYVSAAKKCIDGIAQRGKLPIIVGGTGLYIDTLVNSTKLSSVGADENLREELLRVANELGGARLKEMLAEFDAESAARLHENDVKRLIRAIEIYKLSGKTVTEWNKESNREESEYNALFIGLNAERREFLYERIEKRVDKMFEQGLENEVRELLESGVPRTCTAMQAIGYKETAAFIDGNITKQKAAEIIKQSTRRYAKRQLTWFRRNPKMNWQYIDVCEKDDILNNIQKLTKFADSL